MQKIKLLLLIAAVVITAIFLARVYLGATSPSSVKVVVYKVELMTDASDTSPQVVFSSATGQEIDLTKEVTAVTGQAQMPVGTYKRMRMTVANGIKMSIANVVDNPCGGAAFTDRVFSIAEGADLNSQVKLNFATHDDSGGTWAGSRITHFLLGPVTVTENQTIKVKFSFYTANTLFCSGDAVDIRSPWAVWAETHDNSATNPS